MVRLIDVLFDLHQTGYNRFHHGDCIGSDYWTAKMARSVGYRIIAHPPRDESRRGFFDSDEAREVPVQFPGFRERNEAIAREAQILIAAPSGPEHANPRSGTWMTVRIAQSLGRPHVVITRAGDLVYSKNWGAA